MPIAAYIIVALGAYLLGSLPTGFLVARARGVDIRTVGSKNMGATNVFRVLGKGPGIFVLLMDAFKGFVAVALTINCYPQLNQVLPNIFTADGVANPSVRFGLGIVAGLFSILGHNYTCWLGFKGGKGIATTGGAFLALAPIAVAVALVAWLIAFVTTRYVSVASIVAAVALPATVWFTQPNLTLRCIAVALGILAIYKHKANIRRLLDGTENRFNLKKKDSPT